VFTQLVPSCCGKSGTMQVVITLQVVATRLLQAVRNKFLHACCTCHQLVNNMLRADDIRLVVRMTHQSPYNPLSFVASTDLDCKAKTLDIHSKLPKNKSCYSACYIN
jgi:hypothetical protein